MSKKGDARIERALEKKLKQQQKSARLVARVQAEFPPQRTPRLGADPESIFQLLMEWTSIDADIDGNWSWGPRAWSEADWTGIILPKLRDFATMRWREIDAALTDSGHRMHHSMPVEVICDECQTRLLELEKVDDDIFRFRLGNLPRLWGFRILQVFHVLWYDPRHQVYPTDPD
jgi:hypothetical protein